jgi:hypothetical protein
MSIESRLARLESQNRWLRVSVVVAMLAAIGPWTMGNKLAPGLVSGTQFEIVNDEGETVGRWGSDRDTGGTVLMLSTGIDSEPAISIKSTRKAAGIVVSGGTSTGQRAMLEAGARATRLTIETKGRVFSLPARLQ